jgi:hypothetical protein
MVVSLVVGTTGVLTGWKPAVKLVENLLVTGWKPASTTASAAGRFGNSFNNWPFRWWF